MKQDVFDLSHFDEYREGNRREVKKANGGLPNSLWDTYSSFSNCNGGVVILGVKERADGSWYTTHLQNKNKLLKDFWDTINNRKKVSINLLNEGNVETYEIGGDVIIVIHVPKADRVYKPVYINDDLFGGTFRRDHEGDYHCSEAEVRGMLRDQAEKSTDSRILINMDLEAIREALANCIANADFNFARGIVIIKNPESITIENPGSIITGKAQMLKGGISEPRNKLIIKMFNLIHIGERAGSGVPDIFSVWDDEGWIPPTVLEQYKPDRTVFTLSFSKKQAESEKNKRETGKTSGKRENKRKAGKASGKWENGQ